MTLLDVDLATTTLSSLTRLRRDQLVHMCEARSLEVGGTKSQLARALFEWVRDDVATPTAMLKLTRCFSKTNNNETTSLSELQASVLRIRRALAPQSHQRLYQQWLPTHIGMAKRRLCFSANIFMPPTRRHRLAPMKTLLAPPRMTSTWTCKN